MDMNDGHVCACVCVNVGGAQRRVRACGSPGPSQCAVRAWVLCSRALPYRQLRVRQQVSTNGYWPLERFFERA